MKLETLLQILYANKLDHIVSLAVQIENNIPMQHNIGDIVLIEIGSSKLPEGKIFSSKSDRNKYYGIVKVKIIGTNPYSIDRPYVVELPNGEYSGVDDNHIKNDDSLTTIIDKEVTEVKESL